MIRFWELIKCRVREFLREPSAFVFVLAMPVVLMVCLGYAVNTGFSPSYNVAWQPPATPSPLLEGIYDRLVQIPTLKIENRQGDLRATKADLIVRITENPQEQTPSFEFIFDRKSPLAWQAKLQTENILMRALNPELQFEKREEPVDVPGQRYIDFLIPGLLAFSMLTTTMFGLGMTLVAFRRDGLLKKFLTTPLPLFQLVHSFIAGRFIIFAMEAAIILSFAWLLFDFTVFGSVWSMLLVVALGLLCVSYLSILIGSRISNTGAYNGLSNLIMFPLILLSGMYFSREHFPEWLQTCTQYLPTSLIVDSLRSIAIDGASIQDLSIEMGVLGILTVIFAALSHKLFRVD